MPRELPSVDALRAKIKAAKVEEKDASPPPPSGASLVMRLGTELVAGVTVGTMIGYGIDTLAGTLPLFLLICMGFGTVGGFMNLYRTNARYASLLEEQEKKAQNSAKK